MAGEDHHDAHEVDSDTEIINAHPTFEFIDGIPEFLYSAVVFRRRDSFFHGLVQRHIGNSKPDLEEVVDISEIPHEIFPAYDHQLFGEIIKQPDRTVDYFKRPNLSLYNEAESKSKFNDQIAALMRAEASVFKALRNSPHENLIMSRGCLVSDGRVTALCLPKLKITLRDRVQSLRQYVNPAKYMPTLRASIAHLHSIGFAHNDVNPLNIMFDADDKIMLIDFDAALSLGEELIKFGTDKWNYGHSDVSCIENDLNGLDLIEQYLDDHNRTLQVKGYDSEKDELN